jgi:predicted small lipoprotein YifL
MKQIYLILLIILLLLATTGCSRKVCPVYDQYPTKSHFKKSYKNSMKKRKMTYRMM